MQFLRYLIVQGAAYGLDMGGFVLLFTYLSINPLVANLVGKVLAGLFAFAAHRKFTFVVSRNGNAVQHSVRYFTLFVLNIPLSSIVLIVASCMIPVGVVAKFIADMLCVFITYGLSKRFVFIGHSSL
jgi:putative flippase GtrA